MQKMQDIDIIKFMELKWLKDFISVAENGHFARAADDRLTTQSSLSRRVKSLEMWLGAELFDRSQHPIKLTQAGQEFMPFAYKTINDCYQIRANLVEYQKLSGRSLNITCLHTLKLMYVPKLVRELQGVVGSFSAAISAERRTVEEYYTGLTNGNADVFICYSHPAIPYDIDTKLFPFIDIGQHKVSAYQHIDLPDFEFENSKGPAIPFIEYSAYTYMSRVLSHTLEKAPFKNRFETTFKASLAESTSSAAQQKFGVTWIPETILPKDPSQVHLKKVASGWNTTLTIRLFKSVNNTNPVLKKIWEHLNSKPAL